MSGLQALEVVGRQRRWDMVKASITKVIDRVSELELKGEYIHLL